MIKVHHGSHVTVLFVGYKMKYCFLQAVLCTPVGEMNCAVADGHEPKDVNIIETDAGDKSRQWSLWTTTLPAQASKKTHV